MELRIREQQFRNKTHKIFQDQEDRIEKKRESLERLQQEKDELIYNKEIEKELTTMKKKEDKMRHIFRALEKNTYITEKRKQDWLDKALDWEEKKREKEMLEIMEHQRRLDDIKKKEFYRDTVKKRSNDIVVEKKNKTLCRLEKVGLYPSAKGHHKSKL